jgi:hypothetical protein
MPGLLFVARVTSIFLKLMDNGAGIAGLDPGTANGQTAQGRQN